MIDLKNYHVYIFDCDGVILDSNKIKTNAFKHALKDEPRDKIEQLVKYHKENGGVSRYKKFEYFYKKISPHENYEEKLELALDRFATVVRKELLEANLIPGVVKFINSLNESNRSCFVNSGSDEEELIQILSVRGISDLFKGIFGSPTTKVENTKKILDLMGDKKYLFFGDSKSDYFSAKEFDIDFIYVGGFSEWENYKVHQGDFLTQIHDFSSLTA